MAKRVPMLPRGYTRASNYLFDSDDDTPMPELPVRTINHPAHAGCISPPPPKPVNSAAAPMTKAVASASIAKLSITGQPKPPPKRPAVHMQPNTSYRPLAAAPVPKPVKGSWRDVQPILRHDLEYGLLPISTGYHHVVDGALWRSVAIKEEASMRWPEWGRGIVDLRPHDHAPMVADRMDAVSLLRHAVEEATRIIKMVPCEHKIGMCKCPYDRFMLYQDDNTEWQPWLMCLLVSTRTREGSFFLEAGLIYEFERSSMNIENNINWLRSCDYGGEGPRDERDAREEHFVYVAVAPKSRYTAS